VLTAAVFFWRGGRTLRSPSRAVLLATAVAVFLAVALYYAHFMDTYNTQLARIGAETAAAAPDAGGRGILARLISVPRYLDLYFGIPVLVLAGWGAGVMWRTARTDRLTLAIAGWTLACLAFLVLGVLTPVDMRYYLAAIPVIAIVAGTGASAAWRHGGRSRVAAAIAETGASSAKDFGKVMKAVMPKLAGRAADGKAISELVRQKLGA
jgi:hypothetical protein